jgi:two-component system phosphate regulon sensor histidine kinase PhoR
MRSGKDRYTLRPLRVSEILERVRKNLAILILEHGFFIEQFIEPGLPGVLGDPLAACGCLENLMTNAIKYGGTDRRIRIRATLKHAENGNKEIGISVHDHGMGIPNSELKRIFEPFYRTRQATGAQIPGTGLGLSVSKHLAEAMGGRISVESEVGVGSIFTLYLQAVESQEGELASASCQKDRVTENE